MLCFLDKCSRFVSFEFCRQVSVSYLEEENGLEMVHACSLRRGQHARRKTVVPEEG